MSTIMHQQPISIEDLFNIQVVGDPQISPDGKQVVFTAKVVDAEKNLYLSHLYLATVEEEDVQQFTHGEVVDSSPRWSSDGKQIAFSRIKAKLTQIWLISTQGGEAQQLTSLPEGSLGAFAWSPDGKKIVFEFRPTHPDWAHQARQERQESGLSNPPRIINRLYYRLEGEGFHDLRQHLWVCDIRGNQTRQITNGDWDDRHPTWSPDSNEIAFISNRSPDPESTPYREDIWCFNLGEGSLQKVTAPEGYKWGLSWSTDGAWIAYIGSHTQDDPWMARNDQLWVAPSGGGDAKCLTAGLDRAVENVTLSDVRGNGNQHPVWSVDSERLFFLVSDKGRCHLYTTQLNSDPERVVEGALDICGFSADRFGKRLALLVSRSTLPAEVSIVDWQENASLKAISHMNAPLLADRAICEPDEIWISSGDGTQIQGWLLKPPDFDAQRQCPLVLYIHGGPGAQYGETFFHELQVLAAHGYVVLYTNPRGSLGREQAFATCITGNWGELDYQDLIAATDYAEALSYVNRDQMAVVGGSYGGFMAAWIIGHTNRFRCAVAERGVYNRHSAVGTSDFPPMPDGYWAGSAWQNPEHLWAQSPLRLAANMHTPLLIIHSEGDLRCPVSQGEQLFAALRNLKREVVFLRYPQETNHGFSRNGPPDLRLDRLRRIVAWLDEHLK